MTPEIDLTDEQLAAEQVRRVATAVTGLARPAWQVIDRIDDHLDPGTAPPAVVAWLAACFGVDAHAGPGPRQRAMLGATGEIYRSWGTHRGLRLLVRHWLGVADDDVEIVENGATAWSAEHGGRPPGSEQPFVRIRVRVPDPAAVDVPRLDALIASAVPAHVPYDLEMRQRG